MGNNRLMELRQRKHDLLEAWRQIDEEASEGEGGALSEEQEKRWSEIEKQLESINAAVQRQERLRDEEIRMPAVFSAGDPPAEAASAARAHEVPDGTRVRMGDDLRQQRPFSTFGEQLKAIYNAGIGKGVDPRLMFHAAATEMGEAVDADGGFLVQQDFSRRILQKMHDMGQILRRVDRMPLGQGFNGIEIPYVDETSRATGSRFGAVQGFWVDEGTAPTSSRVKVGKLSLKLKKIGALGYATEELLQDTVFADEFYTQAFAEELLFMAEDSIIEGTGAGQPEGILNANCLVTVAKETGQKASTIVYENIVKMWSRMWARSRPNAVWFINQDIEPQLESLALTVGTGGAPAYLPPNGLSDAPFGRLRGRPVVPIEYASTLGTSGDIILADFSQYMFIDKGGIEQNTSIHVRFTQGEQTFRAIYRVDGHAWWPAALTPFKGTNTLSPFVALADRS